MLAKNTHDKYCKYRKNTKARHKLKIVVRFCKLDIKNEEQLQHVCKEVNDTYLISLDCIKDKGENYC